MTTQILIFHDDYKKSHANRAMADAVRGIADVKIEEMVSLYPESDIDLDHEVARLLSIDRLILQFPIQWYSTPPLLKRWQDTVLTRMYYINAATEGDRLKGLPVMVAATAGNVEEAYRPTGINLFPLLELLKPLQSTAHRCGWAWSEPFVSYRSNKLADEGRAALGRSYADRVSQWIATDGRRKDREHTSL